MWTVVFIANNRTTAETYKDILQKEGLLVQLRSIGTANQGDAGAVEILVPESEAEEAHEIIISSRGA
ncbi:MAG: DUF2007 domain-containing protein [Peptococcaceae bacterium]|nr:DUF2007 domain-containing protein [Peptococcaceae bacterium]